MLALGMTDITMARDRPRSSHARPSARRSTRSATRHDEAEALLTDRQKQLAKASREYMCSGEESRPPAPPPTSAAQHSGHNVASLWADRFDRVVLGFGRVRSPAAGVRIRVS
jgi:hypothetical protein